MSLLNRMSRGPGPWGKGPRINFSATSRLQQKSSICRGLKDTKCLSILWKSVTWYEGKSKPVFYQWKHNCNSIPSTVQQVTARSLIRTYTPLYVGSGKTEHKLWENQASLVLLLISRLCVTWEHANGKAYRIRNQSNLPNGICPCTDLSKVFWFLSLLTTCVYRRVLPFSLISWHTATESSNFFLFLSKKRLFHCFLFLNESCCSIW